MLALVSWSMWRQAPGHFENHSNGMGELQNSHQVNLARILLDEDSTNNDRTISSKVGRGM
jgi:hypothetical protein